jgi:hypothetical protein
MLIDDLELEAWLREAGYSNSAEPTRTRKRPAKWSFSRIPARGEVYAVHNLRPRLKLIPAEHLLRREEVPA